MKKNIILCVVVALGITACNKKDEPLPTSTEVVQETEISLEDDINSETTYTNDHFNFSITLGNDFVSKGDTVEAFKNKVNEAVISVGNTNYGCGILVTLNDFYGTNENYTLDEYIKLDQTVNQNYNNRSNISPIKKTTLNGIDFRYYTFDIKGENLTAKSYLYMANKEKKFYTISIINVTDENKDLISEILKSISIK